MKLKLRRYREERGLTQSELAKAIGKSFRTVQAWEREESFPNAEMIWKLCEVFGTDPNDFLGWYEEHPRADAPALTRDESEIVGCYRASTPARKASLMQTARDSAVMSKEMAESDTPGPDVLEEAV